MKKINKSQFQVVNSCPLNKSDDADEFATTTHPGFNGSNDYLPTFHWTDNYFPRPPDNQLLTPADLPYISKYTINMIDHHIPSMILEFSNNRDPLS